MSSALRAAIRRIRRPIVDRARRILGGPAMDWTMEEALRRLAARETITTIIDVGASNGIWSRRARRYFPAARMLLIEAQGDPHESELRALANADRGIEYVIAAAGDQEGQIHFDATDAFSGAASREAFPRNDVVIGMTTIDAEVARRGLGGPFLIKLDTHGFESEILAGAARALDHTVALIIEAYNFELRPGVLRFHELCALLEGRGFRPIDLADPMRRPKDGAFWQLDLIFGRADRALFGDARYE